VFVGDHFQAKIPDLELRNHRHLQQQMGNRSSQVMVDPRMEKGKSDDEAMADLLGKIFFLTFFFFLNSTSLSSSSPPPPPLSLSSSPFSFFSIFSSFAGFFTVLFSPLSFLSLFPRHLGGFPPSRHS